MISFEGLICWERLGKLCKAWCLFTPLHTSSFAILHMAMNGIINAFCFDLNIFLHFNSGFTWELAIFYYYVICHDFRLNF